MRINRFPSFDGSLFNFNFNDSWVDLNNKYEFVEDFDDREDQADVLSVCATIGETKVTPLSSLIKLYDSNPTFHNQTTSVESSDKDEMSQQNNEEDKNDKQIVKIKYLEPIKYTRWRKKDDRRLYKTL